ncbi:hypothetical protein SAMN05444521_5313 [Streptomyces sp. 3214.6]|nr:hypothetical protein SAMN05444521_5313 [Streptomyces sp. 3214.6]
MSIPELMCVDNAADEDEQLTHLFLADAHAMAGAEHSTSQVRFVASGAGDVVQLPSSARRSAVSEPGWGV